MTTSITLFDCPYCIDELGFDYQKIAKLTYGWRVRVRCPGCGNIVQVVMLAYTLIHGCDDREVHSANSMTLRAYIIEVVRNHGGIDFLKLHLN